jgi:hypothetical protein
MTDQNHGDWTDHIVGDRMTVDQQFASRVEQSEFSSQQWGMIMTAVEFDIENADDPEAARLVADTTHLPDVIQELDSITSPMGAVGAEREDPDESGGVLDTVKAKLGLTDDGGFDEGELEAARDLVDEYATTLQTHLEEKGTWDEIRQVAADQD